MTPLTQAARSRSALLALAPMLALLVACGPRGGSAEAPPADAAPDEGASRAVTTPLEVEVLFTVGETVALGPNGQRALEPGDLVAMGETLRSGPDSELELGIGDLATLRMGERSTLSVELAVLEAVGSTERRRVGLELGAGTVLAKVRALASGDAFRVGTDHALCGVRGTEFLVSVEPERGTRVLVKEGKVAALHSGPVLDGLLAASPGSSAARALVGVAVAFAPLVEAGEELRIGAAEAARADAALGALVNEEFAGIGSTAEALRFEFDPLAIDDEPIAPALREAGSRLLAPAFAVPAKASGEALRAFDPRGSGAKTPAPTSSAAPRAPHPAIAASYALSSRPARGALVQVPGVDGLLLLSVDSGGSVSASDASGAVKWRRYLEGAQGGHPVTLKGNVYITGSRELLVLSGATGAELARRPLEPGLGDRASPFPEGILLASATGFELIDPVSAATLREVRVEGGLGMSPVNYMGLAAVVDKAGRFMLFDVSTGAKKLELATSARNPLPQAPRISGDLACFGDASGLVVLVDLAKGLLRWERRMPEGPAAELELNAAGAVAWAGGTIRGWTPDGEELFPPLRGVSAPPLLSRDTLYFGTDSGDFRAWRLGPPPPELVGSAALGDVASARPLLAGGFLYVGTRGGKLVKLDPSKLGL